MSDRPLTDEELAAIRERRVQARANSAIEGVTLSVTQEALFEQFDAERLTPEERVRRIKLRLGVTMPIPAE